MRGLCAGTYCAACLGIIVCCLTAVLCVRYVPAGSYGVGLGKRGSTLGASVPGFIAGGKYGALDSGAIVTGAITCRGWFVPRPYQVMAGGCPAPRAVAVVLCRGVVRSASVKGSLNDAGRA